MALRVTTKTVVSYTAFPPLRAADTGSAAFAVYLCCTGLGVTSTGRYPASCPVKPGLSSSAPFRDLQPRPSALLISLCILLASLTVVNSGGVYASSALPLSHALGPTLRPYAPRRVILPCLSAQASKHPPPTNSLSREFVGTEAVSTPTKYSRNFKSRLAS